MKTQNVVGKLEKASLKMSSVLFSIAEAGLNVKKEYFWPKIKDAGHFYGRLVQKTINLYYLPLAA